MAYYKTRNRTAHNWTSLTSRTNPNQTSPLLHTSFFQMDFQFFSKFRINIHLNVPAISHISHALFPFSLTLRNIPILAMTFLQQIWPPIFGWQQLLSQNNRSYFPFFKVAFSTREPRTCCVVLTSFHGSVKYDVKLTQLEVLYLHN
jgi:hypothetical protein